MYVTAIFNFVDYNDVSDDDYDDDDTRCGFVFDKDLLFKVYILCMIDCVL